MHPSRVRSFVALTFIALAIGCDASRDCSDLSCVSRFSVTAAPTSGIWQAGTYSLDVTIDGSATHCEMVLPDGLPAEGLDTRIDCGPDVNASFVARSDCSDGCTLADQYELQLLVLGTPATLAVELSRDGEMLLTDSETIEYKDVYPSGPECGGSCQQAHLDLVVDP
jgi:hypothetical protein